MRRQFFDLRPGESVSIGASRVTLEAKTGQRARLRIESDEPTNKTRAEAEVARPQPDTGAARPPFLPRPRMAD